MFLKSLKMFSLVLSGALLVAVSVPASAQQQEQADQQTGQQAEAPEISEAKMKAFATVAAQIAVIQSKMIPEINDQRSRDDKEKKLGEMRNKIKEAIQDAEGITLEEYKEIGEAARQHPEIESRIRSLISAQRAQQETPATPAQRQ